jgi:hypothetical protein
VASTPARSRSRTRLCSHARPRAAVHPAHTRAYQRVKAGPLAPFPLCQTSPGSCRPPCLEETSSRRASHPGGVSARSPSSAHTLSYERTRRPSPAVATPAVPPRRSASVRRGHRAPMRVRHPFSRMCF